MKSSRNLQLHQARTMVRGTLREVRFAERLRYFAGCCGTHLFFRESAESEWVDVAIASLDEPSAFPPEKSIWTEDRLPWVTLDRHRPVFPRSSRESA